MLTEEEQSVVNDFIRRCGMDANAGVNQYDDNGYTPLLIAAQTKRARIVTVLLKAGADINAQIKKQNEHNILGRTALHCASIHGHMETLNALLNNQPDLEILDCKQSTPLVHAVANNRTLATLTLIQNHANPQPQGPLLPPLFWALYMKNLAVVKALVSHGADPMQRVCSTNDNPGSLLVDAIWGSLKLLEWDPRAKKAVPNVQLDQDNIKFIKECFTHFAWSVLQSFPQDMSDANKCHFLIAGLRRYSEIEKAQFALEDIGQQVWDEFKSLKMDEEPNRKATRFTII